MVLKTDYHEFENNSKNDLKNSLKDCTMLIIKYKVRKKKLTKVFHIFRNETEHMNILFYISLALIKVRAQ